MKVFEECIEFFSTATTQPAKQVCCTCHTMLIHVKRKKIISSNLNSPSSPEVYKTFYKCATQHRINVKIVIRITMSWLKKLLRTEYVVAALKVRFLVHLVQLSKILSVFRLVKRKADSNEGSENANRKKRKKQIPKNISEPKNLQNGKQSDSEVTKRKSRKKKKVQTNPHAAKTTMKEILQRLRQDPACKFPSSFQF